MIETTRHLQCLFVGKVAALGASQFGLAFQRLLHGFLQGDVFVRYGSRSPCTCQIDPVISHRTYQGNLSLFLQWQQLPFVFQQHEALRSHVAGSLTVCWRQNVAGTTLGVEEAIGIIEKSQLVFCLQHATASDVNVLHRYLAILQ